MNIWAVMASLGIHIMCTLPSRTGEREAVLGTCAAGSTMRRSGRELLGSVCGSKDGSCRMTGTRYYCDATVQYVTERFPQRRRRLCADGTCCSAGATAEPRVHRRFRCGSDASHPSPNPGRTGRETDAELRTANPKHCLSTIKDCGDSLRCWSSYRALRGVSRERRPPPHGTTRGARP